MGPPPPLAVKPPPLPCYAPLGQAQFKAPIAQSSFGFLAVVSILLGLALTALFFIGVVPRKSRSFFLEVVVSLVASVFLGVGSLFVFLWSGIYV